MTTTFQALLDELRDRAGSDRKAADLLKIRQSSFSAWRRAIAYPDDEQALKISSALQLAPEYVLAAVRADRTSSRAARVAWLRIAERFKDAAALAGVALIGAEPLARAAQCVVRSHRERTYSAIVKSLGAPAATTLAQRPGAPACQLLAGSQP